MPRKIKRDCEMARMAAEQERIAAQEGVHPNPDAPIRSLLLARVWMAAAPLPPPDAHREALAAHAIRFD